MANWGQGTPKSDLQSDSMRIEQVIKIALPPQERGQDPLFHLLSCPLCSFMVPPSPQISPAPNRSRPRRHPRGSSSILIKTNNENYVGKTVTVKTIKQYQWIQVDQGGRQQRKLKITA